MFKVKKIFRKENISYNTTIYSIDKFPNGNILLLGEKIQIYDPNFNLIYLNEETEDFCFSSCILNNDSFLVSQTLNLFLFYKNNYYYSENENITFKTLSYNYKTIIPISTRQVLYHKSNNLICTSYKDGKISIYDFDKNKNYNCFIKTILIEKPKSNLVVIGDNLIFYTNSQLKLYDLKLLNKPPEIIDLIDLSPISYDSVKINEFDKDNVILYNDHLIIKYDFKFKQIKLRIKNNYRFLTITNNYIFAFDYHKCHLLNKKFDFIQILSDFRVDYHEGLELLNGEFLLVSIKYKSSKIHVYKKNLLKCVASTILRYFIILVLSSIILRYFIFSIKKFNFRKIYEYIYFVLIIWMMLVVKRLIFNHLEF